MRQARRHAIAASRATLDTPEPAPPLPRPAPEARPGAVPAQPQRHRDRDAGARPYSIFAAPHPEARRARRRSRWRRAPPSAARIIHEVLGALRASLSATRCPRTRTEDLLARRRARRSPTSPRPIPSSMPSGGRASRAWRPNSWLWEQQRRAGTRRDLRRALRRACRSRLPDGTVFTLRARADRIEHRRDGGFAIVDFKTGQPPGVKEVYAGFSPQLTLEAVMLMQGAFKASPAAKETPELLYVHTYRRARADRAACDRAAEGRNARRSRRSSRSTAAASRA